VEPLVIAQATPGRIARTTINNAKGPDAPAPMSARELAAGLVRSGCQT
jgi:hypothetical protein